MCRSSRVTILMAALLMPSLLPSTAAAQFYGFPSEVGVIDDGFGVLPPTPPSSPAALAGAGGPPPPFFVPPPAPPPCPLVIKVGRGLRRPTHARVVYGRPSPCA